MLDGDALAWADAPANSLDETMLRSYDAPFLPDGGMRLVTGNLGRATFKTSAVDPARWTIEAAVRIFEDQDQVASAFTAGELDLDVVVVVRFQEIGRASCGEGVCQSVLTWAVAVSLKKTICN